MDEIIVKTSKGLPDIEIKSGQANLTSFAIDIWDVGTQSWVKVGDDTDNSTKFTLPGPIDDLNHRTLRWTVILDSLTHQPHDSYDVTVGVSQQGTDVSGSPKRYADEFKLGQDGKPRQKQIQEQVEVIVQ